MDITPQTSTSRGSCVDMEEVEVLLALAHDSNKSVRFNALTTLTHLPLPNQGWRQLVDLLRNEMSQSDAFVDQSKLVAMEAWIPAVYKIGDGILALVPDLALRDSLRKEASRIRNEYPIIREGAFFSDEADFGPEWASSQAPGYVLYSESELSPRKRKYEASSLQIAGKIAAWRRISRDPAPEIIIEDPVIITLLFENAVRNLPQIDYFTNDLVAFLATCEEFRPDLNGLFQEYYRCVTSWLSASNAPLDSWLEQGRDEEDTYSWVSWQIAWTVSRGGLKGLLSALSSHLTGTDYSRQVAALGLIADSADYLLQRSPAIFGGGVRPPRRDPDQAYQLRISAANEYEHSAREGIQARPPIRSLTMAYPRRLSKGEDSLIMVSIHLNESRVQAIDDAKTQMEAGAEKKDKMIEVSQSYGIGYYGMIVVTLSSQDINFEPSDGVTLRLEDIVDYRTIPFISKPVATCNAGERLVRVSVTRKDSGEEILSKAFRIRVDDYAFDHVSRPGMAKVAAIFTAMASVASYALGIFEQIDTTAGLAAGTAFGVFAGAVGLGNWYIYQKPTTSTQSP